MGRIAEVLSHKGRAVQTIPRAATTHEALETMVRNNVGSLVVTDEGHTVGIFTERDFLRRVALPGRDPRATRVADVMTDRLIYTEAHRSVEECMTLMTQERIRHLPVLEKGRLVGLVSIGDLVRHVSAEAHVEVRYLTDYIQGKYPA